VKENIKKEGIRDRGKERKNKRMKEKMNERKKGKKERQTQRWRNNLQFFIILTVTLLIWHSHIL
jgi:hypothetical protein